MPESDVLSAAIGHIKYKVDSMDRTLEHLLLVNRNQIMTEVLDRFNSDPSLVKIYKTIDGIKTQKEIAANIGISEATVSKRLRILLDLDLIEMVRSTPEGKVYQYTKMERLFKISRELDKLEK